MFLITPADECAVHCLTSPCDDRPGPGLLIQSDNMISMQCCPSLLPVQQATLQADHSHLVPLQSIAPLLVQATCCIIVFNNL